MRSLQRDLDTLLDTHLNFVTEVLKDSSSATMPFDHSHLEFSRPAEKVKTIDVDPIPKRIFNDMGKYEDALRCE